MWKIVLAFIVFALAALYMLSKGGDIDMGGEKHGAEATHTEEKKAAGDAKPAEAAAPAAPAADAAKK
jgi:hypothetical protein